MCAFVAFAGILSNKSDAVCVKSNVDPSGCCTRIPYLLSCLFVHGASGQM